MKKVSICLSLAAGLVFFTAPLLSAQDSKGDSEKRALPVVPISLDFRHISQFFRQSLGEQSKYSGIAGFVDNTKNPPWYEMVVRERASSMQVYYTNSKETVAALTDEGDEAYYSNISYQTSGDSQSLPDFQIQFQDKSGQTIQWRFRAGPPRDTATAKAEFLDRPDDHGLVLLRLNQPRSAASGTEVIVGDSVYPSGADALYSENVLIARIQPITQNWNVAEVPSKLSAGSQWDLRGSNGQERLIKTQSASGDQISFQLQNSNDPKSAPMLIDAQQSNGQLALRTLTAQDHTDTLRISFEPALPLPAYTPQDKTQVNFTIDENNHEGVASGFVTATRGLGDEHLTWHFTAPEWAKSLTFDTGVNVIVGFEGLKPQKTHGGI